MSAPSKVRRSSRVVGIGDGIRGSRPMVLLAFALMMNLALFSTFAAVLPKPPRGGT